MSGVPISARYGRLVVLREVDRNKSRNRVFACLCDCGTRRNVVASYLRSGNTRSCGCLRRDRAKETVAQIDNRRHGLTYTPTWRSWEAMTTRCFTAGASNYRLYGGRGITVCDRWRGVSGFEAFLADMGERPDGMSLDRIDVDGDYEPGHCRWATASEQRANQRPRSEWSS